MSNITPDASPGMSDDLQRNDQIGDCIVECRNGRITRRQALKRLAVLLGGAAAASTFLSACVPLESLPVPTPAASTAPAATKAPAATTASTAPAATKAPAAPLPTVPASVSGSVAADDPAVEGKMVEYDNKGAKIAAYLAKPKGDGPFPIVLICHENRGLTEHFKDVSRRFAKAGYAALAIDLLSREGGTDKAGNAASNMLSAIPQERNVDDFRAGMVYMQSQPFVQKARVGMTGFCFGGAVAWRVATLIPEMKAVVPFYGTNPPLEEVPKINAAVLAFYGGTDTRVDAGIPAIEDAMKKANKIYEKMVYDGAGHAFFNDTGAAYNANAAKDAWTKMLAWFSKYLTG